VEQETPHSQSPRIVQCGVYEINLEAGELRKNGLKVRLQEQPFNVLAKLLVRPGQLVTREELQEQLWGEHSLVDAELGLNTAIKKLRAAFGDRADNPRFIETIPKRGYRFLAPVRALESNGLGDVPATSTPSLPGAQDEPVARTSAGDRLAAVGSGNSTNENILQPEPALPAGEQARHAGGAIGRLAWLAAALRGYGSMSSCYGAAVLILILACAGILAGQILYTSLGHSAPNKGVSVYRASHTPDHKGVGIGGYDLRSRSDQAFAFDYNHSGRPDHLALYRPGQGVIFFVKNAGGTFISVYTGGGLGQYDLKSAADRVIAFDYGHSGRQDHLVLYRTDAGIVAILRNDGDGIFTPVYQRSKGPGAVTRDTPADQVFAFDYDHSGKLDHLVLYHPGTGTVEIFTNAGGTLAPVCAQSAPPESTCVYDLQRPGSQALAFDYDHTGKLDHLVFYRPGAGTIAILKNLEGAFVPVYEGQGIGGYNLKSANDRALAFDYGHSARPDHLLLYRPGAGLASILKNTGGTFSPVYEGYGIAGYDLIAASDRAFAFDYEHTGKLDHLVLYRPGPGFVNIARLR
jgi:DNA-binding winged helix-turn-helix (wHTH) protein